MGMQAFAFTKIVVADLDASEQFYRDVLGLKVVTRLTNPDGEYGQEESVMSVTGRNEGAQLLLIRYLNRPAPAPGEAWTGFAVTELEDLVARVEQGGGKVLIPVKEIAAYKMKVSVIADPEGHMVELFEMLKAA